MSRVGSSAITIPADVTLSQQDGMVVVKGKNGELSAPLHSEVELSVADNVATLKPKRKTKLALSLWGTMRASISNMVVGVATGFTRKLEINGVGYRASMTDAKTLKLMLGLSHDVNFEVPEGVTVTCPKQTEIIIEGDNAQLVGQVAANIREYRKPEPYKGKGIKYKDEYIFRKEGKKK